MTEKTNKKQTLHTIGAVILKDKKVLMVRKREREVLIMPGGSPEHNETHEETLKRELKEELQLNLVSSECFDTFEDLSTTRRLPLTMDVYLVKTWGGIYPDSEIKGFRWVGKDYEKEGIRIGNVAKNHLIPKLVEAGRM